MKQQSTMDFSRSFVFFYLLGTVEVSCYLQHLSENDAAIWKTIFNSESQRPIDSTESTLRLQMSAASLLPSSISEFDASVDIYTLGYENIALFYDGVNFTTGKDCLADDDSILRPSTEKFCDIHEIQDSFSSLVLPTNFEDIQLTAEAGSNAYKYEVHYQLFNSLCENMQSSLRLPTTIIFNSKFFNDSESEVDTLQCKQNLIVRGFRSIEIVMKVLDTENTTCDKVYIMVGNRKVCMTDNMVSTVETVEQETLLVSGFSAAAYRGKGMLLQISGRYSTGKSFDICSLNNAILNYDSAVILSPYFPDSMPYKATCQLSINSFDVLDLSITTSSKLTDLCTNQDLRIGNERACTLSKNNQTKYLTEDLQIYYSTRGSQQLAPAFSISYKGYNYMDICDNANKTVLIELPLRLKSPGFPSVYPTNLYCNVEVRTGLSVVEVNIKMLSLDGGRICEFDFIQINSTKYCKQGDQGKVIKLDNSNPLFIRFRSDSFRAQRGFLLEITSPLQKGSLTTQSPSTSQSSTEEMKDIKSSPKNNLTTTQPSSSMPISTGEKNDTYSTAKATTELGSTEATETLKHSVVTESTTHIRISKDSSKITQIADSTHASLARSDMAHVPFYVWVIIGVVLLAAAVLAVAVLIIKRRKYQRLQHTVEFENPTFGEPSNQSDF